VRLEMTTLSPEDGAKMVVDALRERGMVPGS
jgi:hypothetical protein